MNKLILLPIFALIIACSNSPVSQSYEQEQTIYCYNQRLVEIKENLSCLDGLVCIVEDLDTKHRQMADVNHLEPSYICK